MEACYGAPPAPARQRLRPQAARAPAATRRRSTGGGAGGRSAGVVVLLCNTLIKTDHCAHSVRIAVHTVRKGGLAVGLCAQFTVCCTPARLGPILRAGLRFAISYYDESTRRPPK